jgi:hypothetical protein
MVSFYVRSHVDPTMVRGGVHQRERGGFAISHPVCMACREGQQQNRGGEYLKNLGFSLKNEGENTE